MEKSQIDVYSYLHNQKIDQQKCFSGISIANENYLPTYVVKIKL